MDGFVGLPVGEAGGYFARFMPVISTCIAVGMLWLVGRWALVRRGWMPALIAGLTADLICIGMNATGMVTLTGIGGGLACVIFPAKLQNASASIDRIGEEGQVIRSTFVVALVITAVCAAMTLLWA